MYKQDLALNNLQGLIWRKIQSTNYIYIYIYIYIHRSRGLFSQQNTEKFRCYGNTKIFSQITYISPYLSVSFFLKRFFPLKSISVD